MKYGSVCSGIEAASVAWEPLGWQPAWLAEIEPFPSAVLAHRWPHVVNLGDMTKIAARVRAGEIEAPDILVGGTPCQAFSVAGARAGLADPRGQLTLAYVELANAIDTTRIAAGKQPVVTVWENVPGVLSSRDNAFGCFLGALAGEDCALEPAGGKWTDAGCVFGPQRAVAWRVLDAQYFGLAQRRRRVFVVASARSGFDPCAVLFESEGVRRDSAPSREAGKGSAAGAAPGAVGRSWPAEIAATLDAAFAEKQGLEDQHVNAGCPWFVPAIKPAWVKCDCCDDYWCAIHGEHVADCACPPLDEWMIDPYGLELDGPASHIVHGTQDPCVSTDVAFALGRNNGGENATMVGMSIRRLTQVECERLQGFPDGHTAIPWRGKPADQCPDGPRYKAIGNSKAVPVVRWIGERIMKNIVDNDCSTSNNAPTPCNNPERPMTQKAPAEVVRSVLHAINDKFAQREQIMQQALAACAQLDAEIDNGLNFAVTNAGGDELVALAILSDQQAAVLKTQTAGMTARLKMLDEKVSDYGRAFMIEAGLTTFKAHGKTARYELNTKFNAKRGELDAWLAENTKWLSLLQAKISTTALREYTEAMADKYRADNNLPEGAPIPETVDLLPPGVTAFSEFTFTVKAK